MNKKRSSREIEFERQLQIFVKMIRVLGRLRPQDKMITCARVIATILDTTK